MTTPQRYVLGNWKSNTSRAEAQTLAEHLAAMPRPGIVVGVAPPFTWLADVSSRLEQNGIMTGAQNCSAYGSGAYTGEVTAGMLSNLCSFVLIGHSERRALFGDTDEVVRQKLDRVLETSLIPVLCVGETLAERTGGDAERVVSRQLESALHGQESLGKLIVAYEPVWAIGTGLTATVDDASAMARFIESETTRPGGASYPVLYGGSVNPGNAASLIAAEGVSGFLVGGASLQHDQFAKIIDAAIAGS